MKEWHIICTLLSFSCLEKVVFIKIHYAMYHTVLQLAESMRNLHLNMNSKYSILYF